jgi:hypothetical protein
MRISVDGRVPHPALARQDPVALHDSLEDADLLDVRHTLELCAERRAHGKQSVALDAEDAHERRSFDEVET